MKKIVYLLLISLVIVSFGFEKSTDSAPKKINVVIDLGHGGTDFGATIKNIHEKNIVAQIAKKIKSTNKDVQLYFTRTEDQFVSLQHRVNFINELKPDLVLSIHVNANLEKDNSGLDFYIAERNEYSEKSNKIAQELSSKLSENDFIKINELKTAPYFILKNTNAPAILLELGYLTNENDFKYLTDSNSQDKIANSISEFISKLQ
ncbi:N-acetylmuramoyl-L-alanine amidase [Flavobacterium daejeonense]|uniref:N-acetylmuramoyl-L-alanine amidase n=1 Tax=Flavobacterium daejeonense TaxID=350893 RepID=UPI00068B7CE2|nr:N-acetylmuramoyl-L-alanine amidase [Flavobacterium daejeonense]